MSPNPFGRRSTSLASCALRPVTGAAAPALAGRVAQMDPWHRLGFGADALSLYLSRRDPGLVRRAVVAGGDLAGVVCVRHPWLRGPYLELLCLFPEHQGRGLGVDVVGWMEACVRGQAANAWVAASAFNTAARRFYARLGYREIAALDGLVREGETECLLRKVL